MAHQRGGRPSKCRSSQGSRCSTGCAGCERILGECDHPLPIAVLQAKFVELTEKAWGGGAARAWTELSRIEEVADVRSMIAGWRECIRAHGRSEE